ncbi:histidine phosphatase family protein [Shewanella intestini]|uniref:Histidine phosphatase family protein n=1 Tax=Shewanella intestini TaxID=2017544 RepID=A0ABS5I4E0_9GAMM|nr:MULTISPECIES: histidine phosphatase family protein [Shewanella]MBR9728902.1 histidine phosphatase family protein [Shewanella intestini]MRG37032.1 histidine phosphatase family protein [Shewanella sp. XMDDZSB0408]
MGCIYVVRHGQASALSDDYDQLSAKGELQSQVLGQYLAAQQLTVNNVISGTMKRHQQTSALALQSLPQLSLSAQWPELNELDHQNIIANYDPRFSSASAMLPFAKQADNPKTFFLETFGLAIQKWTQSTDSHGYSETWPQFVSRMNNALNKLINHANTHGNVMAFSSGGPISLFCCQALGIPLTQFLKVNQTLVNAGLTKFITNKQGQLKLSTLNQHHYLESPHANTPEHTTLITYT